MDAKRPFCSECHLCFALAEKRVEEGDRSYHKDCDKKRQRSNRIKEFFIRHAAASGLQVVPHHPNGR